MGEERKEWPVKLPSFDFSGKTVVVTGGTKGIGRAIAMAFARCRANVVVSSRHQSDCMETAQTICSCGGCAEGICADVRQVSEIVRLMEKSVLRFGGIDILVNCAGTAVTKRIVDLEEEDYNKVMDTNLKSVLFASKEAAKIMIEKGTGGKIIQIASIGGLKGSNCLSVYGASKAAVLNLTKTMALEWSRYGIQINAICPGYVVTELNKAQFENEKFLDKTLKQIPQRRLGTVDEIAAVALFLACDQSYMIQGEAITADMGSTCG